MFSKNNETPKAATYEVSNLSVSTKELTMKSLAKACADYTIFKFDDKDVRVVVKDGEPWFVATDLCDALNLTNSRVSLMALDDDEKDVSLTYTLGGQQMMSVVNESGMYTLILRCRDAVKQGTVPYRVRKWVTAEVLPSIRKTGSYEKTPKAKKALPGKITTDQQEAIKQLVLNRGKALPKERQAKAMITMWSALKTHFGVTYKEIGSEQFTEALSLAARVPLEGEFLGKQESLPAPSLSINYPMEWFDQWRWALGDTQIKSPWRYPAKRLNPNGDNPNPLGELLGKLESAGFKIDAAKFQLSALQHHVQMFRQKIDRINQLTH